MIPVAEFRAHLEKSAGIGKAVVKGIGETLKFMGRHPVATLATVGTGVAVTAAANRIHDLYHIINEERERRIMKGQTKLLREFWKRKFANIELSTADVYVETSHQLAKAGLLENLDLCNCPVTIVLLRRARLRTVASYLKVGAFSECINMWLWFLSPSYKNNIVPFDDYSRHAGGPQFWYYDEIEARQSFYFHTAPHWLKSARNDHVALAHLEDIVNTESSTYQNFFLSTGLWAFKRETIELPPKCNSTDSPGPERFTHNVQSKFPSGEKATQLGSNFSIEKWCNQHNINPLAGRLRVP